MKKQDATGIGVSSDPRTEDELEGGPPAQSQEWPGTVDEMEPRPDHGEESYRGSGRLLDRKALITGGDSGIGRAVAIAFAREGADVCIGYLNEEVDAAETMRWVREAGRQGAAFAGDLSEPGPCRELVERAATGLGGIDILVNNHAVHFAADDLRDLSDEQLERVFRTNALSYFRVTRAALDHLPAGGAIVNTGSVVALRGHATLMDYAATKGAVHVFTMSLAQSLAERGIRVNCVAPGPVWTPLIPSTRDPEEVEGFGADTYWNRPAQPAELAPAFVFLASADARFVTGEILAVTGYEAVTH